MIPLPRGRFWSGDLDRLKWLGIWLPVTAIGALIIIAEGVLGHLKPSWQLTVGVHAVMLAAIAAGAYLLSTYIFKVVRQKEDEILQKQQELSDRERRFRALIENCSDGIVLLDAKGMYTYASPSTTRLLGYAAEDLVGRSALDIVHPDDLEEATARTLEALRNPGTHIQCEVRIRHRDGSWKWIEAVVSNLLAEPSVRALVKNYRDITERKETEDALHQAHAELEHRVEERTADLVRANEALQATLQERQRTEEALRESQAQLSGIIDSAMDAIVTMDQDQRILVFNAAAERMFRIAAADVIGQPVQRLIPERFRGTHHMGLHDFARTNLEKWWVGMLGGAAGLRAHGGEFPMEAAISQVEVGGRKLFTMILHDTTQQKEVEQQLRNSQEQMRALAAHLQSVREEERSRIAREIQDTLGQALAALNMDLAWTATRLPGDRAAVADRVERMQALISSAIYSVRRIATELRPSVLDDLGLVATVEWQAHEFEARTGIQCQFTAEPGDLAVTPTVGIALFRICQEALTNIARHASASRVTIGLREEADGLVLTVTDNGRGITEQEKVNHNSLGLLGMRERALLLGGQVSIAGRPGEGTTVSVRIPLKVPSIQDATRQSQHSNPTVGTAS
ncbi:MAG TPA: PAS domain S-box protein [Candidatus Methylomirabilis sp.]|nr:PAS domain S-box protein [Candidatus Methylomirabilis sp.]